MKKTKDPIGLSDEHNSRGIELADRGWLDEAINEFNRAIELDPTRPAHDNLATVYAEKKLYRKPCAMLSSQRFRSSPTAPPPTTTWPAFLSGQLA